MGKRGSTYKPASRTTPDKVTLLPSDCCRLQMGREEANGKVHDDVRDGVVEEGGKVVDAVAVGDRFISSDSDGTAERDGDGDLGLWILSLEYVETSDNTN